MGKHSFSSLKLLSKKTTIDGIGTDNPIIENGPSAFQNINPKAVQLAVWDGGLIPASDYRPYDLEALEGVSNHFQGMNRLHNSNYFVLTGSNSRARQAHLMVGRMSTRHTVGPWGSNLVAQGEPDHADTLLRIFHLNDKATAFNQRFGIENNFWHAGATALLGNILAIPLESAMSSKIIFFDVSNPQQPQLFPLIIDRQLSRAGQISLVRLPSGIFMATVLHYSPAQWGSFDFYLSISDNFLDGFHSEPVKFYTRNVSFPGGSTRHSLNGYQNTSLLLEKTGRLFLIGTHNTSPAAPAIPGKDFADLYGIELTQPDLSAVAYDNFKVKSITKIGKKQLFCSARQGSLDAAGTVFIASEQELIIYAASHWVEDNMIHLCEFSSNQIPTLHA